jgi:hypothetical protein
MGAAVEPLYKLPLRMLVETMLARQVIWAERPKVDPIQQPAVLTAAQ